MGQNRRKGAQVKCNRCACVDEAGWRVENCEHLDAFICARRSLVGYSLGHPVDYYNTTRYQIIVIGVLELQIFQPKAIDWNHGIIRPGD